MAVGSCVDTTPSFSLARTGRGPRPTREYRLLAGPLADMGVRRRRCDLAVVRARPAARSLARVRRNFCTGSPEWRIASVSTVAAGHSRAADPRWQPDAHRRVRQAVDPLERSRVARETKPPSPPTVPPPRRGNGEHTSPAARRNGGEGPNPKRTPWSLESRTVRRSGSPAMSGSETRER